MDFSYTPQSSQRAQQLNGLGSYSFINRSSRPGQLAASSSAPWRLYAGPEAAIFAETRVRTTVIEENQLAIWVIV